MSEPTYPIVGIPLVPGAGLPLRQEITAWYKEDANKYQISLFMQALTVFKEVPVADRLSFFQIAGILETPTRRGESFANPLSARSYIATMATG